MTCLGSRFCKIHRLSARSTKCHFSTLKLVSSGEVIIPEPPSYDYLGRVFGFPRNLWDSTHKRINSNTKVLAVEGNIACGKSVLATKLAEHFGLLYFPDPTEDDIYKFNEVNFSFDLRSHNHLLTDSAKYYTCEMFWNEPDLIHNGRPMYLQFQFYARRFWNYLKALATLFHTGRGFVVDRSPFSDLAFVEALHNCGHLSERACRWFNRYPGLSSRVLWKPHLLIYIKTPNHKIHERIKIRNIPWEMNARNLNDEFLDAHTEALERSYLDRMKRYSEVLVIDGSTMDVHNEDDVRIIAQQISEIPLVAHHKLRDDYKFTEWQNGLWNNDAITHARNQFSSASRIFVPIFENVDAPSDLNEYRYPYHDRQMQIAVLNMDPRTVYTPATNPYHHSIFNVMFNPFLHKKNFHADLPKNYLWP